MYVGMIKVASNLNHTCIRIAIHSPKDDTFHEYAIHASGTIASNSARSSCELFSSRLSIRVRERARMFSYVPVIHRDTTKSHFTLRLFSLMGVVPDIDSRTFCRVLRTVRRTSCIRSTSCSQGLGRALDTYCKNYSRIIPAWLILVFKNNSKHNA